MSAGCAEEMGGLSARSLAARGAAAVGDALAAQTYAAFLSHSTPSPTPTPTPKQDEKKKKADPNFVPEPEYKPVTDDHS